MLQASKSAKSPSLCEQDNLRKGADNTYIKQKSEATDSREVLEICVNMCVGEKKQKKH